MTFEEAVEAGAQLYQPDLRGDVVLYYAWRDVPLGEGTVKRLCYLSFNGTWQDSLAKRPDKFVKNCLLPIPGAPQYQEPENKC